MTDTPDQPALPFTMPAEFSIAIGVNKVDGTVVMDCRGIESGKHYTFELEMEDGVITYKDRVPFLDLEKGTATFYFDDKGVYSQK